MFNRKRTPRDNRPHRPKLGRVRYSWEDKERNEPNHDAGMFTSLHAGRNRVKKSVVGPSGHKFTFRGYLGQTSQWLTIWSEDDLTYFERKDGFEVDHDV